MVYKPFLANTKKTGYDPQQFGNNGIGNLRLSARPEPTVDHVAHTDTHDDVGEDHLIRISEGHFNGSFSAYLAKYGSEGTQDAPLLSWNGVIEFVNYRLNGNYTFRNDDDVFIGNGDFGPELPRVAPNHRWSKKDIIEVRDRLRLINPWMKFSPIPRTWQAKTILELLKICWVQEIIETHSFNSSRIVTKTEFLGVDYKTTVVTIGEDDTLDTKSEFITEATPHEGFATYEIDMENGLGPRDYVWPSEGFPTGQELLDRWAEEDRFVDEDPKPRGKLIGFKVTPERGSVSSSSSSVVFDVTVMNLTGQGFHQLQTRQESQVQTMTRTWKLYGDFPSYMTGGSLG